MKDALFSFIWEPDIPLEWFQAVEATDEQIEQLTPKEKEVLIELGKGLSNKEISQSLFITEYTVKKHVSQILAKLELADRT